MKPITGKISPQQFDKAREELQKIAGGGLHEVSPNSGTVDARGIKAGYVYNSLTGELVITVTDHPMGQGWFIERKIRKALEAAQKEEA